MVNCAVRDARPHPEERACRRGSANLQARARVSKDEDVRLGSPSCFEMHRSARPLWRRLRSRCAAMLLSTRARGRGAYPPNEAKDHLAIRVDGFAQAKHQPVGVGNDRRLDFPVSSLLFTGHGATATCRARQRPSRIQVAARLPTRSKSPINPPNTGSTPMPRTTLASRVRSPNQSSPWKVSLERTATMRGR